MCMMNMSWRYLLHADAWERHFISLLSPSEHDQQYHSRFRTLGRFAEYASVYIQEFRFLSGNLSKAGCYHDRYQFSNANVWTEWYSFLYESFRAETTDGWHQWRTWSRFSSSKRKHERKNNHHRRNHFSCFSIKDSSRVQYSWKAIDEQFAIVEVRHSSFYAERKGFPFQIIWTMANGTKSVFYSRSFVSI